MRGALPTLRAIHQLLLLLASLPAALSQTPEPSVSCFAPDGVTVADESYRPCNNLGLTTNDGAVSACCRLNAVPDTRELCDASGLCVQGDIVRRGFCTDSSWEDDACVNFCTSDDENGSSNGTVEVTPCDDGTFCCGSSDTCCGSNAAFTPPSPSQTTPTPATVTATTTSESIRVRDQAPLAVYLGMGGGILAVLLVSLGVIIFLLRQVRVLRRRNGELLGSAAIRGSKAPVLPPTPHVGSMQGFADFRSTYGDLIAKREAERTERLGEVAGSERAGVESSLRSDTETVVGSALSPAGREERDSIGKVPPIPPRAQQGT